RVRLSVNPCGGSSSKGQFVFSASFRPQCGCPVRRLGRFADPQSKVLDAMQKRVTSVFFAAFFCLFTLPGRVGDAVGDLAPNWILPDSKGKPVSLYEEVETGRTIVMFFWASWCKSCKSLLPILQQLDDAKGERPISFYLMNVWEDDDPVAFLER